MANRDMFAYRDGRAESGLVKLWHDKYKESIFMDDIILCYRHNHEGKEAILKGLRQNEGAVEVAVDTLIGWLNSPVGRSFLSEGLGIKIPLYDRDGSEAK